MPKFLMARQPVDEDEKKRILRLAGARHAPADWILRARIVALSWEGRRVPRAAARAGCDAKTVRRWLHRFNEHGLEGLGDRPGCGRKRRITEAERSRVVAMVKAAPPGRLETRPGGDLWAADESGPPEWTLDALAAEAERLGIRVSRSQVRRILLAEGVRWRRTRSWVRLRDPDFAGKGRGSSSSTPAHPKASRSCAPTNSAR
ncbi:helix-turn-helix domain-containing protein [Embleya sp. MST-111070]|uniref:helix-turn-helix domain-containing protein n=1 Tax=Embleya sp. MST-111070 TaxID=3398231 RepID=UPI003F73F95D